MKWFILIVLFFIGLIAIIPAESDSANQLMLMGAGGPVGPTNTPTPCPTQGQTDNGADFIDNTGYVLSEKITIGASSVVSYIQVSVHKVGGQPASIVMGLYNDVAGAPVTLIGTTTVQETVDGWNRGTFNTPVTLTNTVYWMAAQVNTNAASRVNYGASGLNNGSSHTFDGTLPDLYGTPLVSFPWAMVLEVCPQ